MTYTNEVIHALRRWGPLGLMDLRRKVTGQVGREVCIKDIKETVRRMALVGSVTIRSLKRGFLISLKEGKTNGLPGAHVQELRP